MTAPDESLDPRAVKLPRAISQTHWSRTLLGISIAAPTVATVFYLLRLYSRSRTRGKWGPEDYLMGVGLGFSWAMSITQVVACFNGVGHDIWTLPVETQQRVTFLFWLVQKLWVFAQLFVKASIITLLRHLLGSIKLWRRVMTGLIIFTIAWALTAFLSNTLQCLPPQFFWDKTRSGYCMPGTPTLYIMIGSFSLVEDMALLAIPIFMVWRMNFAPGQKIQLTLLFSCGILVCVFSLLRLVELRNYVTENLTATVSLEAIWTTLELNIAICCACVVLMRPLFHYFKLSLPSIHLPRLRKKPSNQNQNQKQKEKQDEAQETEHEQGQSYSLPLQLQPYKNDSIFSQDVCSQVQAHAYPTPAGETTQEEREVVRRLEMAGIMVETAIDRSVNDRETVLAEVLGDTGSFGSWDGVGNGSPAGSVWGSRPGSIH